MTALLGMARAIPRSPPSPRLSRARAGAAGGFSASNAPRRATRTMPAASSSGRPPIETGRSDGFAAAKLRRAGRRDPEPKMPERSKPTELRCAIYTRKSSEEGLEQDLNSLHAQREACEAYIKSQKPEGWRALSAH